MVEHVNPLDLPPGTQVHAWRVVRRLGRGSYAVVYEVENEGQRFALKLACQTELSQDPKQAHARAEREVACLQQLKHPHIVRMRAHGQWPDPSTGFLYIVMDLVQGETAARWAERTGPTPHEFAVLWLKLFDAVDFMHQHGVVHRDLSLNNLMVTHEGQPVIIDFGVADYATADPLTDGPLPPGTRRNRSPEATRFWEHNRHNPEARYEFKPTDDIFALGASLYDLLTDPRPTLNARRPVLDGQLLGPPSPHRVTQGRVPLELSEYVMMLISPDLEVRPATATVARRPLVEMVPREGEAWRGPSVHPFTARLPPAPPEAPAGAQQAVAALVPIPTHPLPVQVAPPPAPVPIAPRPVWRRVVRPAPLALAALALLVATSGPHGPAQPRPLPSPVAEKPTTPPARLASPLPTQQEAPPPVKPPDTSPVKTLSAPPSQPPRKAPLQRGLSKVERCALLVFSLKWGAAGCAGVQPRPPSGEECPKGSAEAMRQELGWMLDSNRTPILFLDVTKEATQYLAPIVLTDGPVTGALVKPLGKAPAGMRVEGHLWTTGDRIYGRYVRAHLPGGRTVPICLEVEDDGPVVGIPKEPGSRPGHTLGNSTAEARAMERWR
ncbi:MAG TPA: protein kinase [Myxococcaceae bacterium]|nr:protein kinase [Myxococcaceae bacterium]